MEDQRDAVLRQRDELAQEIKRRRDAEQKEALQAELAKRRLGPFLRAVWHVVEKRDELQWSPAIDAVCLHLEAVARGDIKNIAISLPPGCLAGETMIRINRGGKGWSVRLDQLAEKFDGQGKHPWDTSIPTMVARAVDGRVRMTKLKSAWFSGVKETFTITTAAGRSIRATADHPFMIPDGSYRRLDQLSVGDKLAVDVGYKKSPKKRKRYHDTYVRHHPCQRKGNGGFRCWTHRLAMEAKINGMTTADFVSVLRTDADRSATFRFLSPSDIVHHRDDNHRNNEQDNLELFDGNSEHAKLHAEELMACVAWIGEDEIASIEKYGEERTYDLEVDSDPHCFLANQFVAHNCTKTKLIMEAYPAWLLGRDPSKRVLCISNSEELGTKSSLACRDILKSDWYRKHFPHVVIAGDQDTKVMYRTTAGGYRLSKSVGSKIIGHKGDIIICFPGETGILTDVGEVPIGEIVADPKRYRVATFNHDTSAVEFHGIVETFRSESVELIEIETADGHMMECTPEHPVFVVGKGYIPAQDIREGDEVLAHESVSPVRQAVSDRPSEVLFP